MILWTVLPPQAWYPPPGSSPSSLDSTNCSSQFSSVDSREYDRESASSAIAERSVQARREHHPPHSHRASPPSPTADRSAQSRWNHPRPGSPPSASSASRQASRSAGAAVG